eukprot:TRINITY_DN56_c0_g1_i2.p1 TRINITY_DN56_c0_g1~~TRINITY_DN56_c0_g1_i2.p1  ORF type:complete len:565 (+),score=87.60 TRINITY_DN56_c0_g1_i2:224-1918(+)
MGDTNGLTEYYKADWPRGCLVDFNDGTRYIYNYVPDGGEGDGDIEVAPVCKVCPDGSDCGYVLEASPKNQGIQYYVFRAHAIGRNVRTMSRSQVKKFCEDQGLILATPHNGYDINEILKQTDEILAKRDEASSTVTVEQPNPWGEDLYIDSDLTPRIAVGLSCSKWDDCTNLDRWYWEDATAPDGMNFGPYKQGTLIENIRYDPPTVEEQEQDWKKAYMEERACGYYDGNFDADYYRNKPGFSSAELDRCQGFYDNLDSEITSDMRSEWSTIANGNTHPKDQCGFIDWEGGADGSTTINVGVCDEIDYEVFACNKQVTSFMIPPKSEKQCQSRDVVTASCQSIFDRESCFKATESSTDSEQDCVWCVHGPCTVNAEFRCATEAFMRSEKSDLESFSESVVVQGDQTASVDHVSSFELCKIIPVEETVPKFDLGHQGSNTCNRDYETMTSETECKYDVTTFFGKPWGRTSSWHDYPKGCFLTIQSNMVYFNTHATGRGNTFPGAHKVCLHEEFLVADSSLIENVIATNSYELFPTLLSVFAVIGIVSLLFWTVLYRFKSEYTSIE